MTIKSLIFPLTALISSVPAFADIPLNISCAARGQSHHEMPARGSYFSGYATLMGGALAQGRVDTLSFVSNNGDIYDYTPEVFQARPETSYGIGEGATGLTFDLSKEKGSVKTVLVVIEGNLETQPNAKSAYSVVAITKKDSSVQKSEALCDVAFN